MLLKLPKRRFCREAAAGRKFISFSKGGSRQRSCPGDNTAGAGWPGLGELCWEVLPKDREHGQLCGKSAPAWGEGDFGQVEECDENSV